MTAQPARQLESPRFENENAKIFAGLRGHYTGATVAEIPQLWQQLAPNLGKLPEQIDSVAYGIVEYRATGGFDYMCAMEVSGADGLPSEFVVIKVPARVLRSSRTTGTCRKFRTRSARSFSSGCRRPSTPHRFRSTRRSTSRRSSSFTAGNSTRNRAWAAWKCGYLCAIDRSSGNHHVLGSITFSAYSPIVNSSGRARYQDRDRKIKTPGRRRKIR